MVTHPSTNRAHRRVTVGICNWYMLHLQLIDHLHDHLVNRMLKYTTADICILVETKLLVATDILTSLATRHILWPFFFLLLYINDVTDIVSSEI